MYNQIQVATIVAIQGVLFITCSCDEVTIIDNGFVLMLTSLMIGPNDLF